MEAELSGQESGAGGQRKEGNLGSNQDGPEASSQMEAER